MWYTLDENAIPPVYCLEPPNRYVGALITCAYFATSTPLLRISCNLHTERISHYLLCVQTVPRNLHYINIRYSQNTQRMVYYRWTAREHPSIIYNTSCGWDIRQRFFSFWKMIPSEIFIPAGIVPLWRLFTSISELPTSKRILPKRKVWRRCWSMASEPHSKMDSYRERVRRRSNEHVSLWFTLLSWSLLQDRDKKKDPQLLCSISLEGISKLGEIFFYLHIINCLANYSTMYTEREISGCWYYLRLVFENV